MTHLDRAALLFALATTLGGCMDVHESTEPLPEPELALIHRTPPVSLPGRDAPAFPVSPLEDCLDAGGSLEEVAAVDNDDTLEHGDVLTFAVSEEGQIAIAADDGTVKFWTLDGFVGQLAAMEILYGAEQSARVPMTDLAYFGDRLVAGDEQGLVASWAPESSFPSIVGGTDPDVRIAAVAVDGARARVAHADDGVLGGNVMVRSMETAENHGPLPTGLTLVSDLAFLPSGTLVMAGSTASGPSLELRDATAPVEIRATFTTDRSSSGFSEVAVSRDGDTVAAVSPEAIVTFDGALALRWEAETGGHVPVSVALSHGGRYVFTVGAEGALIATGREDARPAGRLAVAEPVAIRADPSGTAILVGSRDGALRAFACR